MVEYREKNTNIPLSKETRQELREHGKKGDTYDAIIQKLLEKNTKK